MTSSTDSDLSYITLATELETVADYRRLSSHRRRDETQRFPVVGVRGVNWCLETRRKCLRYSEHVQFAHFPSAAVLSRREFNSCCRRLDETVASRRVDVAGVNQS